MPAGVDQEVQQLLAVGALSLKVMERFVRAQRLSGVSWAGVGRLLGVTRQSAWARWRYLDDEPVEVVRMRSGAGVVEGVVVCSRTGAAAGRLEQTMVARYGAVPAQRLRAVLPAGDEYLDDLGDVEGVVL
jgi:hypothetical protein